MTQSKLLSILLLLTAHSSLIAALKETTIDDSRKIHARTTELENATLFGEVTIKQRPTNRFIQALKTKEDIFTDQQLELVDKTLFNHQELDGENTLSEFCYMGLMAKVLGVPFNDLSIHRYDDYRELQKSGGPHVDQELCLKQLDYLAKLVDKEEELALKSKNINLQTLLDTYGRASSGMLNGDLLWLGDYEKCLANPFKFPFGSEEQSKTRYCLVSFRLHEWPQEEPISDYILMKTGVCVPKSCDSVNYKNKFTLLRKIIDFNLRLTDRKDGELVDLYCLPDAESSLRTWWKSSPKVMLTVTLFAAWLLILIHATRKCAKLDGLADNNEAGDVTLKIYSSLSIRENLKALFDVEVKKARPINVAPKGEPEQFIEKRVVNLALVEGIKVVSMCYIITGHVLMCLTALIKNGRDFSSSYSLPYHAANMIPAFAVNSFFSITGILTAYLMLKANQSHKFITKPGHWIAILIHRYLRLMPTYLAVILYTKTIAKYTSSGPLWDYATSALSQRKVCEQESWLLTLLFQANTVSPLEQCMPSAWYLANDFQFMLTTPLIIPLLYKYPNFGRKLLKSLILLGYLAGISSIYLVDLDDLTPIAAFAPHGFKTYVQFLSDNYTRFQYRIPAYLCGILIGFALHRFEQEKIKYLLQSGGKSNNNDKLEIVKEPRHPEYLLKYCTFFSLAFITFCALTPFLATLLPFNKISARILVSLFIPSYHILYSLAVGLYILIAATGYGNEQINNFLSSPYWKPLTRVSLCALLVNVEVINYIVQSRTRMEHVDGYFHFCMNITCIVSVYVVAAIVYILFEAPISGLLERLTESLMKKSTVDVKKKSA